MAAAEADAEDAADDEATPETETVDDMTVIVRAEVIQNVIDQLLTVVDEAIVRIGYNGLSVAAVDPANVAMVDLEVEPAAFESVGDGMFPIGLNLQRLDDYIDGASGSEPVKLSIDAETRSMNIEHTNVEVEMAGINPDAIRGEPDIPDIDHSAEFSVDAKVFRDAVDNADLVSDNVRFEADVEDEALAVSAEGDTDEIRTVFDSDDLVTANFEEGVASLFSVEYLIGGSKGGSKYKGMLKPLSSGTDLTGKLDDEMPIFLEYEFADGYGSVQMMLAPRIESN